MECYRHPGAALAGARVELHAKEGELRAAYERLAAAALERAGVRGALAAAQAELAGARAELEAWAQAGLSDARAAADEVRAARRVFKNNGIAWKWKGRSHYCEAV